MERQYTASAYVINLEDKKILLVYNRKLQKWLQPGGHINTSELPEEAAIREVKEETGVSIQIISRNIFDGSPIPISIEHYKNKVGDMIDIQYLAIPITSTDFNQEGNSVKWVTNTELNSMSIDPKIKQKINTLLKEN